MSMSTHVYGIAPPDDTWKKMKKVVEACEAAGIEYPPEVSEFFNGERPDEKGVIMDIEQSGAATEWNDEDMCQGYEIDITKLDPKIKIIRVVNCW